jgi:mannose-6-phosphate isomerase-like protein (cupin superfamily)
MKIPTLLAIFAIACSRAFAADAPPTDVVIIPAAKVDDAFAKGLPMMVNSSFKIQAGRRVTAPGQVEVHEFDTDIFYVTEGTATIVTGGTGQGVKPSASGELRGDKIVGGTSHQLKKGDMIVIPSGVPHWFTEVSNPFLYLVIKVTKGGPAGAR